MGRVPDAHTVGTAHHEGVTDATDPLPDVADLIVAGRDREAADLGARLHADHHLATRPLSGGSMDPLTQFDLLGPVLGGVVANLTPDQLDRPTPCAQYDVRGVLEHMIGGATAFAAAYRGAAPTVPDTTDPLAAFGPALGDLGAAVNEPGALERTVAAPFGEVSGDTFARFVVLDGLVHGWDMAMASGQAYEPPDELVAAVDEFAHGVLDDLRDGDTFADAVEPSADATPIERLAAYTGRRPM
jgi:uncharacterized protein (TIGR03086 family)